MILIDATQQAAHLRLIDLPGVRDTRTSKKSGLTTVELDPAVMAPQQVVAAIAELGYTATLTPH